ncbi:DUF429 domain-containing protein [Phaeocystidibacter luteus]|uniref:DUF429 domain-containing protein n=1 Tax=Phaeocystidibacter luteus TaxID=911197 RepID=A0A6N6RI32_9FLAO|nr:DUF429 domain-containing protein [Phaeocystidibacter luteus]KAB2810014.1 DUF429 domain-containing protein [Phaeocystidibacter luteus]
MPKSVFIIGWDAACASRDNGLIQLKYNLTNKSIEEFRPILTSSKSSPGMAIRNAIQNHNSEDLPFLLAIDCPLGWPVTFIDAWESPIPSTAQPITCIDKKELKDAFFKRQCERFLIEYYRSSNPSLRIQPLEVTSNLLARTAFDTAYELNLLLEGSHLPFMLWSKPKHESFSQGIIEVYPAATVQSWSNSPTPIGKRNGIISNTITAAESNSRLDHSRIKQLIKLSAELSTYKLPVSRVPHFEDAIICALTAVDFLEDKCVDPSPNNLSLGKDAFYNPSDIKKEGWIWFPKTTLDESSTLKN